MVNETESISLAILAFLVAIPQLQGMAIPQTVVEYIEHGSPSTFL